MQADLPPEGPALDAALVAWHRRATNILLMGCVP